MSIATRIGLRDQSSRLNALEDLTVNETFIKGLMHNGHRWDIIRIGDSYFARTDGSDTGPYSTALQAEEFIKAIRP